MSSSEPTARWSLAKRLAVWYTASAFLIVALATGLLYWAIVDNVNREDNEFLIDTVRILRGLMHERPNDDAALRQEVEWEGGVRRYTRVFICILDDSSQILMETPGSSALMEPHPLAATAIGEDPTTTLDFTTPDGVPMRMMSAWAQVGVAPGQRRLIKVALDRSDGFALLRSYRMRLWAVLGLALLVAGAAGAALARRGMRPINAITLTAQGIGSSTLHERIPLDRLPAELWTLADTFNEMMRRLEDAFERQASLSTTLAHELRTPANNMRGQVEVVLWKPRTAEQYRETLESVLEDCVALSSMIDALMFLARTENADSAVARTPFDACEEVRRICDFHEPAATENGIALETCVCQPPVRTNLDRTMFQRALSNLITNAIRHTPNGGRIAVTMGAVDDAFEVTVADTGEGIPAEHLARVSDRFYRVEQSERPQSRGLGLGLAIVKSIMNVHGGSVAIDSTCGHGTTVRLTFPGSVIAAVTAAS